MTTRVGLIMAEVVDSWYSERVERTVTMARWGSVGVPVLVFPTAGGDATEIERFHLVGSCSGLLAAGRIKIYSVDSVDGRVLIEGEGDAGRRSYILRQFFQYIRYEVVPAIWDDCRGQVPIIAAGSSIGAFNALGCLCAFPDVFASALCMSGTFDLQRFIGGQPTEDFRAASPLHFLAGLGGDHLDALRHRYVLLASGEGANEDIGESWRVAHELGVRGIPNRLDPWGPHWAHDWPLWRAMLPAYVEELLAR